jgi:hypothetical protein
LAKVNLRKLKLAELGRTASGREATPDGDDARVRRRRCWENSAEVESTLARGRDQLRYGKEAPENAIGENL